MKRIFDLLDVTMGELLYSRVLDSRGIETNLIQEGTEFKNYINEDGNIVNELTGNLMEFQYNKMEYMINDNNIFKCTCSDIVNGELVVVREFLYKRGKIIRETDYKDSKLTKKSYNWFNKNNDCVLTKNMLYDGDRNLEHVLYDTRINIYDENNNCIKYIDSIECVNGTDYFIVETKYDENNNKILVQDKNKYDEVISSNKYTYLDNNIIECVMVDELNETLIKSYTLNISETNTEVFIVDDICNITEYYDSEQTKIRKSSTYRLY